MFADVELTSASEQSAILVPTEAIIHTGTRSAVIVASEHAYRAVEVREGAQSEGTTEILDGLDDGDRIVRSGQFLIDSEASLRATLTRLAAPMHEATP
jgi:Cu(I)/Ag(I) efflux system membrane fusion protein